MKYKCKQRQEIWKKTNRRKAQSSLNRGLDNMANMKEMKRCLTAKPIRVTLPNVCRHKSNRDSRECLEGSGCEAKCLEGSGCEAKRYINIDADSDADSDGEGVLP